MPMNVAPGDRRFLLWAAALILPLILASAILAGSEQESEIPSSYSADSEGTKAAYVLLKELGYKVERWEQSPALLPSDGTNTVLVMASPFTPPTAEEKAALKLYVRRGGRLLITGPTVALFLDADTEREVAPSPLGNNYEPQQLTTIAGAGTIHMSPLAYWSNSSTSFVVHYADKDRPIVVSYRSGRGEIVWWASSGPLTNRGVRYSGNLALLLNCLGDRKTRVLWDEYSHGSRQSLAAYVFASPLKYGLLQCLLVLGAVLLTFSRQHLPVRSNRERSRLSPLEFVETLGGLYRRAHANRAALEVCYTRFRSIAAARLGSAADVFSHDLARALRTRLGYKDAGLEDLLRRIDGALAHADPSEQEALDLVQQLNDHIRKLKSNQEHFVHADRVPGAQARQN
jgi:hypothetical protein